MNRTAAMLASFALAALIGPAAADAQITALQLRLTPFGSSLRLQPQLPLGGLPRVAVQAPRSSGVECPMPVAVPNLGGVERMPVAHVDTIGHFIRIAPVQCTNPLGPQSGPPFSAMPPTRVIRLPVRRLPHN